jgi:hypothetical protein
MKFIIILFSCCFLLTATGLQAQNTDTTNKPSPNTGLVTLPTGNGVLGVFDGRTPCQEMARELHVKARPECTKIKWRVTLFQDSVTHTPTTYKLEGFVYRNPAREGKWAIIKGTASNPNAEVIQLDFDKPQQSIYLLKGDDNVLFFLDSSRGLMVGNEHFGYTLYRAVNKPAVN